MGVYFVSSLNPNSVSLDIITHDWPHVQMRSNKCRSKGERALTIDLLGSKVKGTLISSNVILPICTSGINQLQSAAIEKKYSCHVDHLKDN